ncbi:hypothetical protein Tco_0712550 [Tanacetum coccineum]
MVKSAARLTIHELLLLRRIREHYGETLPFANEIISLFLVKFTLDFITSTTNSSVKFELDELKRRLRVLASSDSSVSESKTESDEEKNVSVVLSLGENEEPKLDLSKKMLRGKYLKL